MTEPKDLTSLRDWFAAYKDWYIEYPNGGRWPMLWRNKNGKSRKTHPYPPTLTAAAGAMPEGCSLEITIDSKLNVVRGAIYPPGMYCRGPHVEIETGTDEITVRYTLAYRACCAMDGEREAK